MHCRYFTADLKCWWHITNKYLILNWISSHVFLFPQKTSPFYSMIKLLVFLGRKIRSSFCVEENFVISIINKTSFRPRECPRGKIIRKDWGRPLMQQLISVDKSTFLEKRFFLRSRSFFSLM